jgi:hypothetical protein
MPDLAFSKTLEGADLSLSGERRTRVIMPVMIGAFAAVVLLISITESRLTDEQLLQSSSFYRVSKNCAGNVRGKHFLKCNLITTVFTSRVTVVTHVIAEFQR